jgi:hypothetical protein
MESEMNIRMACFAVVLVVAASFGSARPAIAQDYTTTLANCSTTMNRSTGAVSVSCTPVYASPFDDNFQDGIPTISCEPAHTWVLSGNYPSIKQGSTANAAVEGYGGVSCFDPVDLHVYEVNSDNTITTLCWGTNNSQVAFGYVPAASCSFVAQGVGVHHMGMSTNRGPYITWDLTVTP